MGYKHNMPDWVQNNGGEKAWQKWLKNRANSCHQRAKKFVKKHGGQYSLTASDWKEEIHKALLSCNGVGCYSKLPLSLNDKQETHPMWPSVDHLRDDLTPKVAIDTRVINDMKTILSEQEFKDIVSHLFIKMELEAKALTDNWRPGRDYASNVFLNNTKFMQE